MTQQLDRVGWPSIRGHRARRRPGLVPPRSVVALSFLVSLAVLLGPGASAGAGAPEDDSGVRVTQGATSSSGEVSLLVSPPRDLSLLDLRAGDITVQGASGALPATVTPLSGSDLDVAVVVDRGVTVEQQRAAVGAADELVRTLPAGADISLISSGDAPVVEVALTDDRPTLLEAVSRLPRGVAGDDLAEAAGAGAFQVELGTGSRPTVVMISPEPVGDGAALRRISPDATTGPTLYLAATEPGSAEVAQVLAAAGGRAIAVEGDDRLISATDEITRELGAQYRVVLPAPDQSRSEVTVRVARAGVVAEQSLTVATTGSAAAVDPAAPTTVAPGGAVAPEGGSPPPSLVDIGILAALAGAVIGAAGLAVGLVRNLTGAPARRAADASRPPPMPAHGPHPHPLGRAEGARPERPPPPPPAVDLHIPPDPADRRHPHPLGRAEVAHGDSTPPPPPPEPTVDLRTPRRPAEERPGAPVGRADDVTIDLTDRPGPAPGRLELDVDLLEAAARADRAVEELEEAVSARPEGVALDGFLVREAVASVTLEGAQIRLQEVFGARAAPAAEVAEPVRAAERLVEALVWGFEQVGWRPLDRRILTELVARRGAFRATPSVAAPTHRGATGEVAPMVEGPVSSATLRAALAREIIDVGWPDPQARGWLGRAAVSLSLARSGVLAGPLLDLSSAPVPAIVGSGGMAATSVRTTIDAVGDRSRAARLRLEALVALRRSYLEVAVRDRLRTAPELVDLLIANPVLTTRTVAQEVAVSRLGAQSIIRRFEKRGWVRPGDATGRTGPQLWVAPEVLAIFESDQPDRPPVPSHLTEEHP